MNKKLQQYFWDLDSFNLPKRNNVILNGYSRVKEEKKLYTPHSKRDIYEYTVDNEPFILKIDTISDMFNLIHEIASSKMLGDLGVYTPPQNPIRKQFKKHAKVGLISQDVRKLENLETTLANNVSFLTYLRMNSNPFHNPSPWHILFDEETKNSCMEIMTEECYDDIISLFLLEELRSADDTHRANYYFFKYPNSDKYNGVIPIDLENSSALGMTEGDSDMFNYFLHKYNYSSCLPLKNRYDQNGRGNFMPYMYTQSYVKRIEMLKHLIHSQLLKEKHIQLIKDALSYNFPQVIRDSYIPYPILDKAKGDKSYDIISRLWEYNNKELSKEL